MSKKNQGGWLTADRPNVSTVYTSATGIWNLNAVSGYIKALKWPYVGREIDYLLVAGGGGGGTGGSAGGGGGGGTVYGTLTAPSGVAYAVTVGAGGSIGGTGNTSSITGGVLVIPTAYGGGQGHGSSTGAPGNGGSGGSGYAAQSAFGKGVYPGSTYIDAPRQGYDGVPGAQYKGGGGSGAGGQGASSGQGGTGLMYNISGADTYYAGGGGGGSSSLNGGQFSGAGGAGGGGNGPASISSGNAFPGTVNSGGGGGGGRSSVTGSGGAGGSGVVFIRYLATFPAAASTTGNPIMTVSGNYRIYKFTQTGTITF